MISQVVRPVNIPAKNKTNISHRFSEGTPISQPQEPAGTAPSTSPALPMAIPAQPSWCPEKPPWGGRRTSTLVPIRHTYAQHQQSTSGNVSLLSHSPPHRWHWQRCPHTSGFALGCFCCVWSQDPVLPSSTIPTAGFLPCLSTLAQRNPQVPQLTGLCKTSGWPLQKPLDFRARM